MTPQQQVIERCNQMVARARELYGLELSNVQVRFDLKGRCAGQAYMKRGALGVRFNRDMLTREAFDHVLNETVPHEYAHIVCFVDPRRGRNHDHGWANVCRELGGTGARRHREEVVFGKGKTFEYITTHGHKVRVSETIHKRIQGGTTYTYAQGKGKVNAQCTHMLVGVSGRTLTQLVISKPMNHPDEIEMARRQAMVNELRARQAALAASTPAPAFDRAASKGSIARSIMLSASGKTKDEIIATIMFATGHTKQMANAYYIMHASSMGLPV